MHNLQQNNGQMPWGDIASEMVNKFKLYKTFSSINNLRLRIIIKFTLKQGAKASFSVINTSSMLKYMSVKKIFILHGLYMFTNVCMCSIMVYNSVNVQNPS